MDRPYYIDENGNKEYYDDIIYIDDVEVTIEPMTREEVDHFMEILKTFKNVGRYDDTLINIFLKRQSLILTDRRMQVRLRDYPESCTDLSS